ncbi:TerC family protein [Candidatus Similichlamydia epinepheli]|uniref:TerC family protein n=1 Tax=Candidatus Similichlamydia epinepheli TaxID=1903953 RepID=UPI000D38FE2C|nr:hypothetical protein [Candidatus Similichlamydia epinepheli]
MIENLIIAGSYLVLIVIMVINQPRTISPFHATRLLLSIGMIALLSTLSILLMWDQIDAKSTLTSREASTQFLSTFLVCSLTTVDNLSLFLALFRIFNFQQEDESRVLKIVLIGKAIVRVNFLFAGFVLISKARWIVRFFSLPILYTGYGLAIEEAHESTSRFKNAFHKLRSKCFFMKSNHRTGIFSIALLLICDTILGMDSIAATLAFTNNLLLAQVANLLSLGLQIPVYILLQRAQEKNPHMKKILGFLLLCTGTHILVFG